MNNLAKNLSLISIKDVFKLIEDITDEETKQRLLTDTVKLYIKSMEDYIQKKNGIYVFDKRIKLPMCRPILAYKIVVEDTICIYVLYSTSNSLELKMSKCRVDTTFIGEAPVIVRLVPISNANDYQFNINDKETANPIQIIEVCNILDEKLNVNLEEKNTIDTNWIKVVDKYKY